MAEILSQSQIDSLLSSLISGKDEPETPSAVAGKKVKDYDFRRPKLFTSVSAFTTNSSNAAFESSGLVN